MVRTYGYVHIYLCLNKGSDRDFKGGSRCYLDRRVEGPGSVMVLCPVILSSREFKLAFPKLSQAFTCFSSPHLLCGPEISLSYIHSCSLDLSEPSQGRGMTCLKFQGVEAGVSRQDSSCGRRCIGVSGRPSSP